MPNREELIDELFAQVVALGPAQRAAFFSAQMTTAGAAATDGILDEVKALLRGYDEAQAEGFLQTAFDSSARQEKTHALERGENFEGYHILELIAEGGMGEVYLAEDPELHRNVAIKLIKGHATKDILRRFHSERQILANLKHPNIAQLYEAGATGDGVPFFVMEYVAGRPISEFLRNDDSSLNDRLKIFRRVCSAVSYAHQNLIIHRDLKPSNILVTNEGEPKLLDFGIAKLLHTGDGESDDATQTGFRALTPQYASPEQIRGETITTASDVYSLGVLLYEFLTGQRPYKLKRNTADEITKAICEQEPTRPSAASGSQGSGVGSQGEDKWRGSKPTVSEGVKAASINPKLLRGDLDNIILKALRKEPERRYASVEQFSEDIRRHLEGLPVTAHKGSFTYRAGKFIKRNKIAAAAAALIVLTLAAGIIATTVEARRANRRFNEARQLAHTILFDYHDQIAALPGSTKVRERLVKDALQYLDTLSKDTGNDVSLLRELASAYERVAQVQGGFALVEQGNQTSAANLGDTQGALASGRKALAIRQRLISLDSRNRELQDELAYGYEGLAALHTLAGPPEKVIEYTNQAIPIMEASRVSEPANEKLLYLLASAYVYKAKALGNPASANLGDAKGAIEFLSKGQAIIEKLGADHPTDVEYQRSLGVIYNLASLLATANGDEKQGLGLDLKAVALDQHLVDLQPLNQHFKEELAIQLGNAGSSMLRQGDTAGALDKFKQALTIYESLAAADPNDANVRRNSAVGYRNVATATGTTNPQEANRNFQKALQIFADMTAKDPSNGDYRRQWAYTYLAVTRFQIKSNDPASGVQSAQEGIKIDEQLVASSPTNATAWNTLALLYRQMGDAHAALGAKGSKQQWSAAKEAYQKSLDIYRDMKSKGTLSGADANKPDELAKEIAKCDEALTRIH